MLVFIGGTTAVGIAVSGGTGTFVESSFPMMVVSDSSISCVLSFINTFVDTLSVLVVNLHNRIEYPFKKNISLQPKNVNQKLLKVPFSVLPASSVLLSLLSHMWFSQKVFSASLSLITKMFANKENNVHKLGLHPCSSGGTGTFVKSSFPMKVSESSISCVSIFLFLINNFIIYLLIA